MISVTCQLEVREYEEQNQSACENPGIEPGTLSTINQHVDKRQFYALPRAPARPCVTLQLNIYKLEHVIYLILTPPMLRILYQPSVQTRS